MPLVFDRVTLSPLRDFEATALSGAVIGIIGATGAGKGRLLRLAAGVERPAGGSVVAPRPSRLLGSADALDLTPVPLLLLEHTFARADAHARDSAAAALDRLRRAGSTVLVVSHEEELQRRFADEIWWIDQGRLAGRGDPARMLAAYRRHVAQQARRAGEGASPPLAPGLRRGDGRAEILGIRTLGANGCPTMVWQSGEEAAVQVRVRFRLAVADPVIGILIRTRIGLNVYGTNTELEHLRLGPCAAGDMLEITFAFRCELCADEYTLTAASHDPDGVWHDWLEDAVAFRVTDTRYTAGVANLRAEVRFRQL